MLKGIGILSLGIMMISSVMVLSLGVDDAFAGKGTKKLFITGISSGVKVKLDECVVTTNLSGATVGSAKGNGVVHVDLSPVDGVPPFNASGTCKDEDSNECPFGDPKPIDLETHGPTKIFVIFPCS